jgi:multicomponent Na+:H+ antiporter subunit E
MHYITTVVALLLVYLALTGNLQPSNLLVGALVAALATVLVRPAQGPFDARRLPGAVWATVRYIGLLAADVVKSGIGVARIVLAPKLPIRPGIVAVPSGCSSELAQALSAHALSITPGEVVIGIEEGGTLYTHCLDATHSAEVVADLQALRRNLLSQIFE